MRKTQLKGVLILFLTAFIWGSGFVAQSLGADTLPGFSFNGIRTLIGGVVLLPVIFVMQSLKTKKLDEVQKRENKQNIIKSIKNGAIVGVVLFVASSIQQFAFYYTAPGKVGFVTAFYMFFVPLISLFFGKKTPLVTWGCVVFGIVGLYFLCIPPQGITGVNKGDVLAFICAVCFAVHIIFVEKFGEGCDAVVLSCTQFFVGGSIALILGLIFEHPTWLAVTESVLPLLYAGVLSCGVAFTLQIVGQKYTDATVASLIMCLESVFGVICSAVILHSVLSGRELLGCGIMFAAIVISQIFGNPKEKTPKKTGDRLSHRTSK